jgi:hypothetical protein
VIQLGSLTAGSHFSSLRGAALRQTLDAAETTLDSGLLILLLLGVLLAVLLALPLALRLAGTAGPGPTERGRLGTTLGLAVFVAVAMVLSHGVRAADTLLGFTAPAYAATIALIALTAQLPAPSSGTRGLAATLRSLSLPQLVARAALLLWTVGAGWLVIDAFGLRPLGFSPLIVRLTAIHFHYAAFIVPVIAAFLAAGYPSALTRAAAVVSVLGAPATAVGITAVQFGAPRWVEALFALPMIAGALLVAAAHLSLAFGAWGATSGGHLRILRLVVGATLLGTMALAGAYAGRAWLPWAPTLPQMAQWHGIGNAVGVAFCGLLACWMDPAREILTGNGA